MAQGLNTHGDAWSLLSVIKLGPQAPQQGCGVSGSQCSLVLYRVQHCHPHHSHTYPLPPAFMQTEMSLVPGTVRRPSLVTLCCALRLRVTEQTLLDSQALAHRARKAVFPGMPSAEVQHSEGPPSSGKPQHRLLTLPSDHYSRNYLV